MATEDSSVPVAFRTLPCQELTEAYIDAAQKVVRFDWRDAGGRLGSGTHTLSDEEIHVLNEGGLLVLRDQSGREIALRV